MAAITICSDFGAQRNKVCHCFHCFPIYLPWSDGTRCHDLNFLNAEFYARFFTLFLFTLTRRLLSFSSRSAISVVLSACLRLLIFLLAGASVIKNLPANVGDANLILGSGRSPGGGLGNPLQYYCWENPMDRGAWQAAFHKSQRVWHNWATEHTHTHTHTISIPAWFMQSFLWCTLNIN